MGRQAARPKVLEALTRVLREDPDRWVREEAARALGAMGAAAALREALRALEAQMARAVLAGQEPDERDRAAYEVARESMDALGPEGRRP